VSRYNVPDAIRVHSFERLINRNLDPHVAILLVQAHQALTEMSAVRVDTAIDKDAVLLNRHVVSTRRNRVQDPGVHEVHRPGPRRERGSSVDLGLAARVVARTRSIRPMPGGNSTRSMRISLGTLNFPIGAE
jgi:hypothetical protein